MKLWNVFIWIFYNLIVHDCLQFNLKLIKKLKQLFNNLNVKKDSKVLPRLNIWKDNFCKNYIFASIFPTFIICLFRRIFIVVNQHDTAVSYASYSKKKFGHMLSILEIESILTQTILQMRSGKGRWFCSIFLNTFKVSISKISVWDYHKNFFNFEFDFSRRISQIYVYEVFLN